MIFYVIYKYWYPMRFLYQMMFVPLTGHTTGVQCGPGTANPSGAHVLSGVRVAQVLVFRFAYYCIFFFFCP
jgi:hypothetical protein